MDVCVRVEKSNKQKHAAEREAWIEEKAGGKVWQKEMKATEKEKGDRECGWRDGRRERKGGEGRSIQ